MTTHPSLAILASFLLGFTTCSFGQVFLNGKISDHQQQGLPFATVILLASSDSSMVKGTVSNNDGDFIFENVRPGKYLVAASMVGYHKSLSQLIPVTARNTTIPDIMLKEVSTELSEVVVTADKPLYEQQVDRLVVNVHNSITSAGNTVLEVLQKSPGIVVNRQNNSIMMNGKSGVRVMMNGKTIQLSTDAVIQMLDGMSAANIEKIEIITTPPAQYDAEGNAGIIHLVAKENADFGTNGTFGVTLGYKWAETSGANLSLHHRGRKVAYFLDYSVLRERNRHILKMARETFADGFNQEVNDSSNRKNITTVQNLRSGAEWKLRNNSTFGLLFTAYRRNWNLIGFTDNINRVTIDSSVIAKMDITESNIWQSASGAMRWQTKPDAKREITLDLDYLYYHNW